MNAVDIVVAVLLVLGGLLSLIAGIAVLRFPDTASRVHAATKPQLLGIVLLMIALGLRLSTVAVVGELVLIIVLQMLTAPVAAHLAVREAYRRPPPGGEGEDGEPRGAGDAGGEAPDGH